MLEGGRLLWPLCGRNRWGLGVGRGGGRGDALLVWERGAPDKEGGSGRGGRTPRLWRRVKGCRPAT